ncbi:uncharacterized protein LOC110189924 [Drosophila serrata]|uniref:uncharacterized protein LOC110189924 n=1 Tax=Drosophila serrata TaxID=7274 RepID=UPI000A1D37EB|nr:uncharacterized protein LOC110189924 [Drosophila serrata]XP_020815861.1 uncharacterized protein LOC110189924 [Drosophila serrata]
MPLRRKLIKYKCCFCMSLKTGCVIISFYTLFFGFINAGTIVDDAIYKQTSKTDKSIKWFNVFHIALMIAAAVVLLIAIMSKIMKLVILWITMFVIHMISYYIVFHALPYGRNPYFHSALSISVYVLAMLITLVIDLYCILIVYFHYYVTRNPDEFRPPCVDK